MGQYVPDSKFHGANMGPTWVLSAPDGPHVGPMNFAIRDMKKNQWKVGHSRYPVVELRYQRQGVI